MIAPEFIDAQPKRRIVTGIANLVTFSIGAYGALKLLGRDFASVIVEAPKFGASLSDLALSLLEFGFVVIFIGMVLRAGLGRCYAMWQDVTGRMPDTWEFHRKLARRQPKVEWVLPLPCKHCGRGGGRPWGRASDSAS